MKTLIAAGLAAIVTTTAAVAAETPAANVSEKIDARVKQMEDRTGFGVNAGVSTLGATIEPVWRINNRFGLRAPIGSGSFEYEEDSDGETFKGDMEIGGIGLLADFYPTGKNFRLTAGAFKTNYSADLLASNIEVGSFGVTDVEVNVRQKKDISPYLGIGYDGRIGKHGTISFGLGAIFGDGFDVTAKESSGMAPQSDVDAEVADIRDTLGDLGVVPYASIMVGFRF